MPASCRHFFIQQWANNLLLPLAVVAALFAPFNALSALLLLPGALASVRRINGSQWLAVILLSWLLWLPASLAWSLAPGLAIPQIAVLICLPLGWLIARNARHQASLNWLLESGLPISLAVLVFWGLWQGPDTFTFKPQGPFNDPNTYAAVLDLLALPILARYLSADLGQLTAWRRTGLLALLAGTALVFFLVASRGATLALLLVAPVLFWMARCKPDFKRKLALLAVVAAITYVTALVTIGSDSSVALRLVNTVEGGDPLRLMLMRSAWHMIEQHPLLGTGFGSFRLLYPRYREHAEDRTAGGWVHNDYLQFWQEAGLPMLLLLLGLAAWVLWRAWRTTREGDPDALPRMGYLAGIVAILLHALVNFLFFYTLVSLLLGLYLARVEDGPASLTSSPAPPVRAVRMISWSYAIFVGWLLAGQVAVDVLLGQAKPIQYALLKWRVAYPRYEIGYWLSVVAPTAPAPRQIMGLELAAGGLFSADQGDAMRDEALLRMEEGWDRAPCYQPYANDALDLFPAKLDADLRRRGQAIVARSLECDPRHGLTYYYAGRMAATQAEALQNWNAGMAASPFLADRLLLVTAMLSRSTPAHAHAHARELSDLADKMSQAIRAHEANPGTHFDQSFWIEAQYKLVRLTGARYQELLLSRLPSHPD
jgi:O-antigen ligase